MTDPGRTREIQQGSFELDAFVISLVGDFDLADPIELRGSDAHDAT